MSEVHKKLDYVAEFLAQSETKVDQQKLMNALDHYGLKVKDPSVLDKKFLDGLLSEINNILMQ